MPKARRDSVLLRGFLVSTIPEDVELPLELRAINSERLHVRPDDVLTEVAIHFDNDRPRQARTRHDEVVTLRARFDATE
jgi:hypothetical protein